ncbi:MAG: RsmD family RNA methyltransferase, partial [Deltaproteobacteria bacterium]|nr:RsmD family RNA methyltransferase [Deltaproteobacteria bacterium]
MRIVGGTLGGRRFDGPPSDLTRPTSERVREALASALDARDAIRDVRVLDLFAGTGALAFEALSRGATDACLVERDPRVVKAAQQSIAALGLGERCVVVRA